MIGFGGRKLPDTDGPKYQNSRDNVLYNKSKVLYGLNWAKADAVNNDQVVICEGYTDVIGFNRAGLPRAVATCGTALTEEHVQQLKKFTRHLVLAYDADDAGQAAADRVYAWEQTHDIEVSVVSLPDGADPDELARTAPDTLRDAVAEAQPFLAFRVDRVLRAADLRNVEGRARAAEAALVVVAEHPDGLVRDQYVMQIADICRVDADRLRERLEHVRRNPAPAAPTTRPRRAQERERSGGWGDDEPLPEERPGEEDHGGGGRRAAEVPQLRDGVETEALRLVINDPSVAATYLDEHLFSHPTVRTAYQIVTTSPSLSEAIEVSPAPVAELLTRLAVETSEATTNDVLSRLATEVGRQVLADLEAEARSSEDPLAYSASVAWLKVSLDELRSSRAEVETLTQLLAWLRDRRRATDQG